MRVYKEKVWSMSIELMLDRMQLWLDQDRWESVLNWYWDNDNNKQGNEEKIWEIYLNMIKLLLE